MYDDQDLTIQQIIIAIVNQLRDEDVFNCTDEDAFTIAVGVENYFAGRCEQADAQNDGDD